MSIEELLANESFIRYCKKSNSEDIAYWQRFLEENPAYKPVADKAFELYHDIHHSMDDLSRQENILLQKISAVNAARPVKTVSYHRIGFWLKWSVAACILVAMGYYFYPASSKSVKQITYSAANGERKTLQLPDGTLIILNGGSTLSIDEAFNKTSRNVSLLGEAYFEVKPNKELPFIVYTAYMDVRALGTSFNIKAYAGEKAAETVLIKGLVEVTLKDDNNKKLLLQPYQGVRVNAVPQNTTSQPAAIDAPAHDKAGVVQNIDLQREKEVDAIAWTQNRLIIDDHSLEEIASMLERWYGVNTEFVDQDIREYRYTGAFEKEELTTVLDFLIESKYFRYEIINGESRTLKLYRK